MTRLLTAVTLVFLVCSLVFSQVIRGSGKISGQGVVRRGAATSGCTNPGCVSGGAPEG